MSPEDCQCPKCREHSPTHLLVVYGLLQDFIDTKAAVGQELVKLLPAIEPQQAFLDVLMRGLLAFLQLCAVERNVE